jgi:AraC family transcriptional activator of pobA
MEHRDRKFYAKLMGMRSMNLNGMVKMTFGKGVFGMVMDRMMLEAEVLLLETTVAMKEVAYELGFSELSYFSIYFKRVKGVNPVEFRRLGKKE